MCGICGFVTFSPAPAEPLAAAVTRMADTLAHRGPDGEGSWVDAEAGLALGHRRLAIIDLSPAGQQPMLSANGRFALSYNGEIYNYRALRAELEAAGVRFRSQSDTEVLLEACALWGAERALSVGLVGEVCADEQLQAVAGELAARLAAGPTFAFAQTKTLIQGGANRSLAEQLAAEQAAGLLCGRSADAAEALRAVAEKRSPQFKGR